MKVLHKCMNGSDVERGADGHFESMPKGKMIRNRGAGIKRVTYVVIINVLDSRFACGA